MEDKYFEDNIIIYIEKTKYFIEKNKVTLVII